jgi:hypothetical protein
MIISQVKEKVPLDSNTKGACLTLTGFEYGSPMFTLKLTS